MKNRTLKIVLFSAMLFLSKIVVYAQHGSTFTQYIFNEAFINPAYIGSQDALAINASYRNQWVGIDGAPVTQTFVAHAPAFQKKVGIGLTVLNEHVGVLKTTAGYINLAYRIIMPKATLSFGLLGGLQSVREDFTKVKTIQSQDEQFMYNNPRVISPNMGFGFYYYTRKLYAGLSVPRVIQTAYSSSDSSKVISRVNPRDFSYYAALGYVFDANENVIWKPYIMTKLIQGAPVQADFALTALMNKVLWIGASYRTDRTLSGILGIQFTPQFKLSYSYDYTFSDLQKYNSGSHEIQLSYIFSFNKEKNCYTTFILTSTIRITRIMKFLFRILLSILFTCYLTTFSTAQNASAPLHLKQANKSFYNKAYSDAIPQYLYSIKKDSTYHDAIINLADCYRLTNDAVNAELWYKRVVKLKERQPIHQLYLGEALMENRKYEEAKKWFELYSRDAGDDSRGYEHLQTLKQLSRYFKDSSYVKVKKININSTESDFSPIPFNGNLIYTSARKRMSLIERTQAWTGKNFFSLYIAEEKDSVTFTRPKLFAPQLQINYNNGPLSISRDLKTIYFTRNNPNGNSSDKIVKLEIYESHILSDNNWDEQLIPFRWNSNTYNCAHPALNADGTKLYFTSDMNQGYGGMDLYVCKREGDVWGEPENLGPKINSAGNEVFPYVDQQGILYFSSDGHDGLGGLDIFSCAPAEGGYSPPENVGAPINSNSDDFGITVWNKKGYFSSNRGHKGIDDDIYYFRNTKPDKTRYLIKLVDSVTRRTIANTSVEIKDVLTKESLPVVESNGLMYADLIEGFDYIFETEAEYYKSQKSVPNITRATKTIIIPMTRLADSKNPEGLTNVCLTGNAYSSVDGKKIVLSNASIVVIDNITKEKVTEGVTNASGKYKICNLPLNRQYKIQTAFSNYFGSDTEISTLNIKYDSTIYQELTFEKIVLGKAIKIQNLIFEAGKATLTASLTKDLDKIVEKLKDNSKIVVELGVHTDCRGLSQINLDLSDERAHLLKEYVVSKGVDSKRVTYIGYGEAVPVNKCECEETVVIPCSEQEHQQNNRVELKVIGFLKNGIIVSE